MSAPITASGTRATPRARASAELRSYAATVFANVGPDNFFGYTASAPLAEVDTFRVEAHDPQSAVDALWPVGNKMRADADGKNYPRDVRSLSVGDLIRVTSRVEGWPGRPEVSFYAVSSFGWTPIPEPANPIVPIEGTEHTSRKADLR